MARASVTVLWWSFWVPTWLRNKAVDKGTAFRVCSIIFRQKFYSIAMICETTNYETCFIPACKLRWKITIIVRIIRALSKLLGHYLTFKASSAITIILIYYIWSVVSIYLWLFVLNLHWICNLLLEFMLVSLLIIITVTYLSFLCMVNLYSAERLLKCIEGLECY